MTEPVMPMEMHLSVPLGSRLVREKSAPWLILSLSLAVTLWGWRAISAEAVDWREPLVVLALGLTISALLFAVVRSIANTQVRAVALAGEMTEALRKVNEDLEGRVKERTRELDAAVQEVRRLNEQLERRVLERTAQLEAATRELEAFSYSVSHDLRAPLRHVHGFAKLLQQRAQALDETTVRYVATITNAAAKMANLIDDLLALSRTGRAELRAQEVDLGRLVTEVSVECGQEAKGRRISWKLGSLPSVTGDPALLRIAFVNLLSNAVKFTAKRDEALIEVDAIAGERGEVIVRVKDNGAGFDNRYAQKLFGVFQRLHRDDEFEGTGIGLATVQRVVHRHGGRVWAEGTVDQGATLYVALPGAQEGHAR